MRGVSFGLRMFAYFAVFSVLCSTLSCSIPNLESRQCTEARDSVKEFYSWYTGTDSAVREKQRDVYDKYVGTGFRPSLGSQSDPFYLSDVAPTTFKIGKCELKDESHVTVQIQLYWREQGKTDQKEVYADVSKNGDKWLIDKVEGR
jgi:hypothetical protein